MAVHTVVIEVPDGVPADRYITGAIERMVTRNDAMKGTRVLEYHFERMTEEPEPEVLEGLPGEPEIPGRN